ncbi:MAG: nucleoside triphosphate pyrophosphohydrolase [Alphaproteobacteria bacterium]|nr:nucleoside triphosphate pyrophosphohydrolase [Alphaproteobacteria bacterium]
MIAKRRFKMETLVRDKMPKRMNKMGVHVEAYPLTSRDLIDHLKIKLEEEIAEVLSATTAKDIKEEISDVIEVLYAISKYYGLQVEHIEKKRLQKQAERGGFAKGLFVDFIEVEENDESQPVIEYCLSQPDKYPEVIGE